MIQKQGAVQPSIRSANIDGLVHFSKKFTLRRTNEDGTKTRSIKKSVQGVMRYATLDGDNIWLAAISRYGGGVTGYFSCVLLEIKPYSEQWTQCPSEQIYWFLLWKGCDIDDVRTMIKDCFSIYEQMKMSKSRWSKSM